MGYIGHLRVFKTAFLIGKNDAALSLSLAQTSVTTRGMGNGGRDISFIQSRFVYP